VTDDNFDDYVVDKASMHDSAGDDVDIDVEPDTDIDTDIDTRVPDPATWTRPEPTGVASVDAAIEELAQLDELPTREHVAVYDGLHRQLQDALADLDGT
jgi:hypothetical protein